MGVPMHGPFHKLLIQIFCRCRIIREQRLAFVFKDWGLFTLIFVIVVLLVVFFGLVVFFSSKDDTPADTPDLRRPFSQLSSLAKKLCSLVPPLGRAV